MRAKAGVAWLCGIAIACAHSAWGARPLDTEDTGVIPFGHAEAEVAHVYLRDRGDHLSDTSVQLGIGAAPRLEASLQAHFDVLAPDSSAVHGGVADTLMQLKYALLDEHLWRPAALASFTLRLPTGSESRGLGFREVDAGFIACASKMLGSLNLIGNLGYTLVSRDRSLDFWTIDGALEYAAARSLVAVAEAVSAVGDERTPTTLLLRTGFVYALSRTAKLDVAVGFGATRPTPDFIVTTGVTFSLF